jgi:hypothetical protein
MVVTVTLHYIKRTAHWNQWKFKNINTGSVCAVSNSRKAVIYPQNMNATCNEVV